MCLITLLSGSVLSGQTPTTPLPAPLYRIAGTVVNSATGEAISHATMEVLLIDDHRAIGSIQSGEDGSFEFQSLPAGKYELTASKRGFLTAFYDQHEFYNSAIVTGPNQETEHLTFHLIPNTSLRVEVSDNAGDPVDHAKILLFQREHKYGLGETIRDLAQGESDDTGSEVFFNLEPGIYYVAVIASPWYAMHITADEEPDSANQNRSALDVAYPVTFFDSTTDQASATPVELTAGHHENIKLVLQTVHALHLSVQGPLAARDDQEAAPPQLKQSIFGFNFPVATVEQSEPSSSGMVTYSGLAPGKYELQQDDPPQLAELNLSTSSQLTANPGTPATTVRATVHPAAGTIPPEQLKLNLEWADQAHPQPYFSASCEELVCTFAAIPPGQWMLWALDGHQDLAIVSTTVNGKTRIGNLLTVTDRAAEIAVAVQSSTTRIDGFALKDGKGHANVMVVLVPDNPAVHSDLFHRDQADSDGSFSLRNAAPGAYTVVAIEDGWGLDWQLPGVIAPFLKQGVAVTVPEGSQQVIRLSAAVPVQSKEEIPAGTSPGTSSKPGGEDSL
jgi:hypothetical protein